MVPHLCYTGSSPSSETNSVSNSATAHLSGYSSMGECHKAPSVALNCCPHGLSLHTTHPVVKFMNDATMTEIGQKCKSSKMQTSAD